MLKINILLALTLTFWSCENKADQEKRFSSPKKLSESERPPLKVFIRGKAFGYGAIIYMNDHGQSSNELFMDDGLIGVTSYPYSSLIQKRGEESKYQFFRIIDSDTLPMEIGGITCDSLTISQLLPVQQGASNLKNKYCFLRFYAGESPKRSAGVPYDSTELGQWEMKLEKQLKLLDKSGKSPQCW